MVTPVEVGVEAVLRGAAGAVVRIRNPGGTLPDGSGVGVEDQVVLQRGQRYVVAVRDEPDGSLSAGGCGLTRALSRAQAAAVAAHYHTGYRPVPDGAVQPDDPPAVDWRGRVAGVLVGGRARQRRHAAALWSGWVQQ